MKIISLSSDQRTFRTINFRPKGISLILGDGEHVAGRQDGDSNGVGKTLALRLVHHCLGADKPPRALANALGDWWFYLDIEAEGRIHRIGRTGDGSKISLDDKEVRLKPLRSWLNEHGGFNSPDHSFRALFPRFARRSQQDSSNPICLEKEQPHEALLRTLYLLNADESLARRKVDLKDRLDLLKAEIKLVKNSTVLREVLRAGQRPETRLKELNIETERLRSNLMSFQVSEDYRAIEEAANDITSKLRDLGERIAVLSFELEGIREAQQRKVDISKEELFSLYRGLHQIFKPEVLQHFDQVAAFQTKLISNRLQRLTRDEAEIATEIDGLRTEEAKNAHARDQLLKNLSGKRALDEYVGMTMQLATMEEERLRLQSFVGLQRGKEKDLQIVRSAMVSQDVLALQYAQSDPLDRLDLAFRNTVQHLYPDASAGINLRNNSGENKIQYDIEVSVQGQDSDGIGNARILCFDWTVFCGGRSHDMNVLWHDNRLFADLDPKPRAAWFELINSHFMSDSRQYVASLNFENYQSMAPLLSDAASALLEESVVITLKGDKDSNRLLGLKIG